ncbi:response regulator [Candidatus Daviesbacteria bacterium]|nr:response regulator [Candidatus Daviesbacteria bacterium]
MQQDQKKVFIIEDQSFIAELYAGQLTKAGFLVKIAGDGKTGLAQLSQENFDILLLDILLPDLNGLEVLRQIRVKKINPQMVVLLLTNLGQDTIIQEAFALGANGYLIKATLTPFQVVDEVKNALTNKPVTV